MKCFPTLYRFTISVSKVELFFSNALLVLQDKVHYVLRYYDWNPTNYHSCLLDRCIVKHTARRNRFLPPLPTSVKRKHNLAATVWNLFTWMVVLNRLPCGRVLIRKICFAGYHTFVCHQVVNIFFHLAIHWNERIKPTEWRTLWPVVKWKKQPLQGMDSFYIFFWMIGTWDYLSTLGLRYSSTWFNV